MNNRIWLKVLSVLLGVFAWIYVNLVIPPQIRRTLPAEVEYRNIPEMVIISPAKPTVQVQMEGTRRDFILSRSGRVQVSVDLYNVRPGRAQLPVRVIAAPGLTVVSVSPPQVQIEVIPVTRKKFDVKVVTQGQPAEGYIADEPRFTPDKVSLEGPENLIDRVTECVVEVNLDQIKNSLSEQYAVKVLLENGVTTDEIQITPGKVALDILVKQGFPTKTLPLAKPMFINRAPEGKKLENFKVTPETVVVSGPARIIGTLNDISFKPIDLSGIAQNATMPLKLELPERVSLQSSVEPVLYVEMVDVAVTKIYDGLSFELKKTANQHTSVSVASYSLEVEGLLKDLELVRNAQLKMVLDIEKMKPGSYTVNLTAPIGLPKNVGVVRIRPDELTIQISELSEMPAKTATGQLNVPEHPASATVAPGPGTTTTDIE
ncbi:MAG: hypothetical protein CVV41_02295 [Candidatus Riflebacteria bacterium HGW-Riflebacteria-1]|jgi:YbbR domain-containing protein|nr:MAG: hypothetical protein CVV41_02295 [Candidatus Riflebacteria bacterium HGW-Riflebacteria-1]